MRVQMSWVIGELGYRRIGVQVNWGIGEGRV